MNNTIPNAANDENRYVFSDTRLHFSDSLPRGFSIFSPRSQSLKCSKTLDYRCLNANFDIRDDRIQMILY